MVELPMDIEQSTSFHELLSAVSNEVAMHLFGRMLTAFGRDEKVACS
jgi:hypothetical protein